MKNILRNPAMNAKPTTVLIIGAGPTGLTLACELARRHVPFRIVDASVGPQVGSRGKGVQPRSLEVFDNLGIIDRVLANGRMDLPIRTCQADGQVKVSGGPVERRSDVPYPSTLITPEWRIEETLRDLLNDLGGGVEFGTSLQTFTQSADGVQADFSSEGGTETVEALWLVGCDGGHSTVRKQAGIAFQGETREEVRMIVADVKVAGLDRDNWHIWQHSEGFMALCPLPSTDMFQYQAAIGPNQDTELDLANLQAILDRRSANIGIQLQEPEWLSLWRANIRLAEQFRSGRVFLAGDAAHIHSPAGGQGMNTGIQDAQNLGWKLASVLKGVSPSLLDSYEGERRPIAVGVLALSNQRLKEAIDQKNIPTNRNATTMQLNMNYRGSILVRDDREATAALRAGDRAPDACGLLTMQGECRLFDLTRGPQFTLFSFGAEITLTARPDELSVYRVVARPPHTREVADASGHLSQIYNATDSTLLLVRPDGYIGFISDAGDVSALTSYLSLLGLLVSHDFLLPSKPTIEKSDEQS